MAVFEAPMVVGYKGEIGRFILSGLLEYLPKANDIHCTDVNNSEQDVVDRLSKADYVFLCVPLQATSEWLLHFAPFLDGKIVVEQCSVKSFVYEESRFEAIRFISMHLLFRPSATPARDRACVLFSSHLEQAELEAFAREIEQALQTPMTILDTGEEPAYVRHDRIMARQQALVHRVLLELADELQDAEMRTYVGRRVCELADRIHAGDPTLYRMIQENPFAQEEIRKFRDRLADSPEP